MVKNSPDKPRLGDEADDTQEATTPAGSDLSLQGPDGLHPNDSGYEVMAQTWFDVILKLVADTES